MSVPKQNAVTRRCRALLALLLTTGVAAYPGVLISCFSDAAGRVYVGTRTWPLINFVMYSTVTSSLFGLQNGFLCTLNATFTPTEDALYRFQVGWDDNGVATLTRDATGATLLRLSQSSCCGPVSGSAGMLTRNETYSWYITWGQGIGDATISLQYSNSASISNMQVVPMSALSIDDTLAATHNVPSSQLAALAALYSATQPWSGGSSVSSGWLQYALSGAAGNPHPCSWYGVLCSFFNATGGAGILAAFGGQPPSADAARGVSTTTVTEINIRGATTRPGALPSSIASLTGLRSLQFSSSITGPLPATMASMSNLTYLDISGSQVALAGLPALRSLTTLLANTLAGAAATSMDGTLASLTSLTTFRARGNAYSSIPSPLSALASLSFFDMTSNRLSSLNANLCNLPALTQLLVAWNAISTVAPCIVSTLPQLTTWDMQNNAAPWAMPAVTGALPQLSRYHAITLWTAVYSACLGMDAA